MCNRTGSTATVAIRHSPGSHRRLLPRYPGVPISLSRPSSPSLPYSDLCIISEAVYFYTTGLRECFSDERCNTSVRVVQHGICTQSVQHRMGHVRPGRSPHASSQAVVKEVVLVASAQEAVQGWQQACLVCGKRAIPMGVGDEGMSPKTSGMFDRRVAGHTQSTAHGSGSS